jgi:N-formylglutamate deformylase
LNELKGTFGKVLLWDCHSIKQVVPTIQAEKFPDMILGDADGHAASKEISNTAFTNLNSGSYSLNHNHPFKGGFITRNFGRPLQQQHALQLEMTKVNYMDDAEMVYEKPRAEKIREVLKKTLHELTDQLMK